MMRLIERYRLSRDGHGVIDYGSRIPHVIAKCGMKMHAEKIAAALNIHQGAVGDQRAMEQVANAVESLRAGKISAMSAWSAVVDAVDRRGGQ